ncbi:T9SS type A sorting domain-containing protein [Fulvivirgaceae bacterium BMA12]|uniref:T9SS type A sorting domain-containing protein n=1 Tax=Agaribacillus aureus TaxID=3051825 RepID=A0ABT8L5U0_9BACT|nr:T9SS type A sorting domain-containing protein [Fulvivirgaceae bacterium BMA12]
MYLYPVFKFQWPGILTTICLVLLPFFSQGQQQITVNVSPGISASINGELELKREKYFNLAASSGEIAGKLNDQSRFDAYFKDMEMTVGRQLGMVFSEKNWGNNSLREDPGRPGYMDVDYFISKKNPNDNGLDELKAIFGDRQGIANHDRHNGYPDFMDQYTIDGSNGESYPTNNDAAAEMVAYLLKHRYTDFRRPSYFELVNEPHWKFWGDPRFVEFHTKAKEKVDALNIPTEIGGPCFSVAYFYRKEYESTSSIIRFMDDTNFSLDFYSFHAYDYMRWDDTANDFVGTVTSGLPLEGVFDALAGYTFNKYGKEFTYVASEHGGYITDADNRTMALNQLADKYFPGSGFAHEMEKRSIDNFIMVNSTIANTLVFMNHPHIVKKSVPFILLESAGWDPYYYSSLLVKENFDKNSPNYAESKLIDFYKYFAGVKGRRIESFTADTDIQHMSFVDGKKLIMLFHNQSNEPGELDIDIEDIENTMQEIKVRKLSRGIDFRPVLTEETATDLDDIIIEGQGSVVVFVSYENDIEEDDKVDEVTHYSLETSAQFNGSKTFTVDIPEHKKAKYGILRVGVSRDVNNAREMEIKLNGTSLNVPLEDCADRITQTDQVYATTKIVKVDGNLLREKNTIEVSFPDGKSGGVGAVVVRAALMDREREGVVAGADSFQDRSFEVYPVPGKGLLNVKSHTGGKLQIIDFTGKTVWDQYVKAGVIKIDINNLSRGNYVVRIVNKNTVKTRKIFLN